jgi:hypothetical protein
MLEAARRQWQKHVGACSFVSQPVTKAWPGHGSSVLLRCGTLAASVSPHLSASAYCQAAAVLVVCLQVTERYPWSGELVQNGRRDMRRGKAVVHLHLLRLTEQQHMGPTHKAYWRGIERRGNHTV